MSWGFVAGAAISVVGGAIASKSAKKGAQAQANAADRASQTQAESADKATALQREIFEKQQANQQPWLDAGRGALGRLTTGLAPGGEFTKKFSMSDFTADPGYQWRLAQGTKAIQGTAAAGGSLMSGRTLKALSDYGANQATQTYNDAYNRWNNDQTSLYNKYSGLAGVGQQAVNQVNSSAGQYGSNVGNIMTGAANNIASNQIGAGNAAAASSIAQGNAWTGALNNTMNWAAQPSSPGSTTSVGGQAWSNMKGWFGS